MFMAMANCRPVNYSYGMENHRSDEAANPRCPDHSAHSENARDRLYPAGLPQRALTSDEFDAIDAEAEAEYLNCEGH